MSSNKYPYTIIVTLNGRRIRRERFTDYERYMRAFYDFERRYPEFKGYDINAFER